MSKKKDIAKLTDLIPDDKNFNKHSQYGMSLLEKSMRKDGFVEAGLISEDNVICSGNARQETAINIGMEDVQIIDIDGTKPIYLRKKGLQSGTKEFKELALQLNAVGKANVVFDTELIEAELGEAVCEEWGVELSEKLEEEEGENDYQELLEPLFLKGDLIEFNNHRLLVGDSCNVNDIERLMNNRKADLIFTDPPYDLEDNYTAIILNEAKNDCHVFIMDGDKNSVKRSYEFDCFRKFFVCDFRIARMISNNQPMQRTTLIAEFLKGKGKFNNMKDGFTTLIESAVDHKKIEGTDFRQGKKVELPEIFILHYSKPNELVVDFFGGAGSTLIAAEKNNRNCYMMEYDQLNATIIINRWVDYMKKNNKLFEIKINGLVNNNLFN